MPIFYKLSSSDVLCVTKEAARYAGYRAGGGSEDAVMGMVEKCCALLHPALVPQAVYEEFDLKVEEIAGSGKYCVQFADIKLETKDLGFNLKNCRRVIVLAATVGAKVDMLIRRAQTAGSADAALMQGAGAMFIESFVDNLNEKLKAEAASRGLKAHPRYSPGYGDVPVTFQKEIFRLLPCSKIGLTLMDTMIMAPEKSVTAFIGLE